jgi:effector-binding domain-containing protein
MQIKTLNTFSALCFSVQTNIEGLNRYVRIKARELYKEAVASNLEITGPVYWIYTGMDGRPETIFKLEIVIPVSKPQNYSGSFSIVEVAPIKCLYTTHLGSWEKLPETYGLLFGEFGQKGYVPTGICREMYINMDFDIPENNVTEVQIGIQ